MDSKTHTLEDGAKVQAYATELKEKIRHPFLASMKIFAEFTLKANFTNSNLPMHDLCCNPQLFIYTS